MMYSAYRNNLTVIDALIVSGKGATSNLYIKEAMEVGEEEADIAERYGSDRYIRYDVKEASLKSCLTTPGIIFCLTLPIITILSWIYQQ